MFNGATTTFEQNVQPFFGASSTSSVFEQPLSNQIHKLLDALKFLGVNNRSFKLNETVTRSREENVEHLLPLADDWVWKNLEISLQQTHARILPFLEAMYKFRSPESVKQFLQNHPVVIPVLLDAKNVIVTIFGQTSVALEVVTDPEAQTGERQLFGYIDVSSLSPDVALERLDTFDRVWFSQQYMLLDGILNFNLE